MLPAVLVLGCCVLAPARAEEFCTVAAGPDQITGMRDGYRHELWNQDAQGSGCMALGRGAAFSARWSNIHNYLARRGLGYDQTRSHRQIGALRASFDAVYRPVCTTGNSYMGVYGWTYDAGRDDLIEYYILDNWCNWIPSMDAKAQTLGMVMDDGAIYDVIRVPRENAPSIKGKRSFLQIFSIRRDKRTQGRIDISHHFDRWEQLGLKLGNLHEVSFVVEGYKNSGSAEFRALEVTRSAPR